MTVQWKDPDTDVVHVIVDHGVVQRAYTPVRSIQHTGLVEWMPQQTTRHVAMYCGIRLTLSNDEAFYREASPIARPWLHTQEAPTCMTCASVDKQEDDAWGVRLRGA